MLTLIEKGTKKNSIRLFFQMANKWTERADRQPSRQIDRLQNMEIMAKISLQDFKGLMIIVTG